MDSKRSIMSRLISSAMLIAIVMSTIFLAPIWLFSLVVSVFILLGTREFFSLAAKNNVFVHKGIGLILAAFLPIITWLQCGDANFGIEPFYIVLSALFIFIIQLSRKDNKEAIYSVSITLFGILYISWLFSFIIKIRYLPNGPFLVFFLILVTKGADAAAYFIGSLFGKHYLIPHISPKKTIEGTMAAFVTSVILALASRAYLPFLDNFHLLTLGILFGFLGQIGDLSESLLKRNFAAKDSSNMLRGLGGVLDVLDSLLFTTPIFYFYLKLFI